MGKDRRLTTYDVILTARNGNRQTLEPCGTCPMNPWDCKIGDGDSQMRALSTDRDQQAAFCLKNRVPISVNDESVIGGAEVQSA